MSRRRREGGPWVPTAADEFGARFSDSIDGVDARDGVARKSLRDRDYSGCHLTYHHFRGYDLTGTTFVNANLRRADFRDADLTEVDFTGAQLRGADFAGAVLCRTTMPDCSVRTSAATAHADAPLVVPED
jgi:uncharacterized protein YjbI with pentapeptide repeats